MSERAQRVEGRAKPQLPVTSYRLLVFTLFVVSRWLFVLPAYAAGGASLQFSPASGTFFLGSTFNVSFTLDTGGKPVNAVEVQISYPPDKIQVANPSIGTSFISIWVTPPSYSNSEGKLVFRGGVPTPGIITSGGVISTATFRARDVGDAELVYSVSSQILANDGKGTNVLEQRGVAHFTIAIPPPEGPEVFSPTNPDPNVWYRNAQSTFFWKKAETVDGFSYAYSQDPFETPDEISEGVQTSATFPNKEDGVWYFHIHSHAGDTWGGVTHYLVRIDRSLPAEFSIEANPKGPYEPGIHPTLTFFTTDGTSGINHYEVRTIELGGAEGSRAVTFFTEETSPYLFPLEKPGSYQVVVRAFDTAGNTRDATYKLELTPAVSRKFSKEGFRIFGFLVRWIWLLLFLGLLLLLLLLLIWFLRRKHGVREEELKQGLAQTEEQLLREYQAMYEKVKKYRGSSIQNTAASESDEIPPPPAAG